jgi:hypothetical protein
MWLFWVKFLLSVFYIFQNILLFEILLGYIFIEIWLGWVLTATYGVLDPNKAEAQQWLIGKKTKMNWKLANPENEMYSKKAKAQNFQKFWGPFVKLIGKG